MSALWQQASGEIRRPEKEPGLQWVSHVDRGRAPLLRFDATKADMPSPDPAEQPMWAATVKDATYITVGNPNNSLLYERMGKLNNKGRMANRGTKIVDVAAMKAIDEWIRGLWRARCAC
jgi:hypothetical protein